MTSTYVRTLSIANILLFSAMTYAGWTSGGAGFVRDSENPWFLKNTEVVQYCIKIDEKNFGIPRNLASERITQAINFWKKELAISRTLNSGEDIAGVGTQLFVEVACTKNADIQFLLGVLPDEEIPEKWMPTSFIGTAVRTSYDQENMKGKGFIYISPDSGPLKYNSQDMIDGAWSLADGHVFRVVVMHELGHVFGLPHQNGDNYSHLMHRSFPEMLLNKSGWEDAESRTEMEAYIKEYDPAIFKYRPLNFTIYVCSAVAVPKVKLELPSLLSGSIDFRGDRHRFFNIPDSDPIDPTCLWYRIHENKIEIWTKKRGGPGANRKMIGVANVEWADPFTEFSALIAVWLPPGQKALPDKEAANQIIFTGFQIERSQFKGEYLSLDGQTKREVFGQAKAGAPLEIGGKIGDKVFLRIF